MSQGDWMPMDASKPPSFFLRSTSAVSLNERWDTHLITFGWMCIDPLYLIIPFSILYCFFKNEYFFFGMNHHDHIIWCGSQKLIISFSSYKEIKILVCPWTPLSVCYPVASLRCWRTSCAIPGWGPLTPSCWSRGRCLMPHRWSCWWAGRVCHHCRWVTELCGAVRTKGHFCLVVKSQWILPGVCLIWKRRIQFYYGLKNIRPL